MYVIGGLMENIQSKKLAIISDCVHIYNKEGRVATENHIFRKQMETLAMNFESTVICCPFVESSTEKNSSAYNDSSIKFIPLPKVGGDTLRDKWKLIKTMPYWFKIFNKVNKEVDVIYQRFPNNLNIPGFFYFYLKKKKVFATYTGTWNNYNGEPSTYRLQKWLLKKYFRGPVAAYIPDKNISGKIFKSFSPSYSLAEWNEESEHVEERIKRLRCLGLQKPVFVTAGALINYKNQQYILEAFKRLHEEGFDYKLYVAGDGPLKKQYEVFVLQNKLSEKIIIAGKKTSEELREIYRMADFIVQAPLVEGFGKVPVEGFFHGVIPILNNISLAKEITGNEERGFTFSTDNVSTLTSVIRHACSDIEKLRSMICNGRAYAKEHTLEVWAKSFIERLNERD